MTSPTDDLPVIHDRSTLLHDRIRPTPASPRGSYRATVKENTRICTDHYRLVLSLPSFPRSAPGQFIQIDCADPLPHNSPDHSPPIIFDWPPTDPANRITPTDPDFNAPLPYLRRPFSLASHQSWPDGYTELTILHRVIGKGTLLLAQLKAGNPVSILGPLGCGFSIPRHLDLALLVGGGVGIPPMFYLAKELRNHLCKSAVAFVGAQRHDLLPVTFTPPSEHNPTPLESSPAGDPVLNVEEFKDHHIPAVITTDDGSRGMKGFITQPLANFLEEQQTQRGPLPNTIIFCCGPTPMMKATAKVAAKYNVQCQLSLEQPMACGMGTCQSCIIRHKPHDNPNQPDWTYKLTCTHGPVFDARDILW